MAAGSFRKAFASNCKGKGAGDTFTWDGRSYSCARASDKKKVKPKAAPKKAAPKKAAPKAAPKASPKKKVAYRKSIVRINRLKLKKKKKPAPKPSVRTVP